MSTMEYTDIISSIPGRTRFKLPASSRNQEEMARIANGIKQHPEVDDVEYNVRTGSILVHHDTKHNTLDNIKDIMQDLCVAFLDVTEAAELVRLPHGKESESSESSLSDVLCDLNDQVYRATNGMIDLRLILPLGLAALGALQFINYGWQFEIIPWYLLIYFAVDTFIRLNLNPEPAQS